MGDRQQKLDPALTTPAEDVRKRPLCMHAFLYSGVCAGLLVLNSR